MKDTKIVPSSPLEHGRSFKGTHEEKLDHEERSVKSMRHKNSVSQSLQMTSGAYPKKPLSNKFQDTNDEEAFQAWSFQFSGEARLAVIGILVIHALVCGFQLSFGHKVEASHVIPFGELTQWWYLLVAVPFILWPRSGYDRRMVLAIVSEISRMDKNQAKAMVAQFPSFKQIFKTTRKIFGGRRASAAKGRPMLGKGASVKNLNIIRNTKRAMTHTLKSASQSLSMLTQKVGVASLIAHMPGAALPAWKQLPWCLRNWKVCFACCVAFLGGGLMIHNHLLAVEDEESFADRLDSVLQDAAANYSHFASSEVARKEIITEVQKLYGMLLFSSATAFMTLGQGLAVAVRIDFLHQLCMSCFLTLVMVLFQHTCIHTLY
jgi:hypothetical protein